jgi:predicted Zn-dependent protease
MYYASKNQNDKALTYYLRALALSPDDPRLMYNAAVIYLKLGNKDEAIRLLLEAKNKSSDDEKMLNQINSALRFIGN